MKQPIVVSDFDGVIGDSLNVGVSITRRIVALFDPTECVSSFRDYYRFLGKDSALQGVTERESETLRELYRILHRHSARAILMFEPVLSLYARLRRKPMIVSSSYADTVRSVIGEHSAIFDGIYGYESGRKGALLERLATGRDLIYVTDTSRDVVLCKQLGIPVIATCWGYDALEELLDSKPDYLARSFSELGALLTRVA